MTCEPLPNTGLDAPVLVVLAAALLFLLIGLWILLRAKRLHTGANATLMLAILAVGASLTFGLAPTPSAYAAPSDCPTGSPGQTTQPALTTQPAQTSESEPSLITESATEPGANSLTITQTSRMNHLAPGVDPVSITGRVVNNGPDDTFITAISVEITSVTKLATAKSGPCDASDYLLLHTRMSVGKALAPNGGSTDFGGALIGFNNKSVNQDACQGARIRLLYRANPA